MSGDDKIGPWIVVKNYPDENNQTSFLDLSINKQTEKLEKLEKNYEELSEKVEDINKKLDKLIQSNKSLLEYFSSVRERDIRDLNYVIRGYRSKNMSPIHFVPDRSHNNL